MFCVAVTVLSNMSTSRRIVEYLDLNKVDGLSDSWCSCELASIQTSSSGWDNLTTSTMDSVSVQSYIMNVESYASHVLLTQYSFFGSPLRQSYTNTVKQQLKAGN